MCSAPESGIIMVRVVATFALNGINGIPVFVEATHNGTSPEPRTNIIGLPDTAVKEAMGRVTGCRQIIAYFPIRRLKYGEPCPCRRQKGGVVL